ncbi:MAG: ribosome recycling factor [Candidatus Pacebacteria bacterium]|jgi:ribosome recycling factor|nr:ribosome recycling factor [Candidatus Paceibacterota bacterium]
MNLQEDLEKNMNFFKSEIASLSIGRATPYLVEDVTVDYYGTPTPLKQVATIGIPDSRTITIQPFDRSILKDIEKAINLAQLGLNPGNNGEMIRIAVPQPTEERRKDLAKLLNKILENARVGVRSAREEAMKEIKNAEKNGEIGEDDRFTQQEEIQKLVNDANSKLEEESKKKEAEILTV